MIIKNRINDFKNIGFNDNDIINMTSLIPSLLLSNSNIITDKFKYLKEFGYKDIEIIQIIKKLPILFKNIYFESINKKLDNLIKLGFSKDEVISVTGSNPYIFIYSEDCVTNKFNILKDIIDKNDLIKMYVNFPLLFGYSLNNILSKINYYNKIKLDTSYIVNPKILMFPLELIKARYFYLSKKDNNYNNLFLEDYKFYKKYKIKTTKLLAGDF